ncbi:zinc ribbon domain-containing protein, partial [Bacillus subtilis]|uniref:zinc ribbon domain-containing protein n=1 Tax=Bacillus subtilis TaxID=1423 RepID=UPI003F4D27D4
MKSPSTQPPQKQIPTTLTPLSNLFHLHHNPFLVLYSNNYRYSHFYNKHSSTAPNIFHLFFPPSSIFSSFNHFKHIIKPKNTLPLSPLKYLPPNI